MNIIIEKSTKRQIVDHYQKELSKHIEQVKVLLAKNDQLLKEANDLRNEVSVCERVLLDVDTMASSFCDDPHVAPRSRRLFHIIVNFIQKNGKGTK